MSDFSKILGSLRREVGRSQRKAAQDLGVSQALLSHYENGAREPKLEFVSRVCAYYGVTADYILGRTSERGGSGAITLKWCPDGAAPVVETMCGIFTQLRDIKDCGLTELTLKYLAIPIENVCGLLKNPGVLYDPMRDAELKTVEAQLVTRVRRARDNEINDPENQGCSDD